VIHVASGLSGGGGGEDARRRQMLIHKLSHGQRFFLTLQQGLGNMHRNNAAESGRNR
jgi:hypothetical protein